MFSLSGPTFTTEKKKYHHSLICLPEVKKKGKTKQSEGHVSSSCVLSCPWLHVFLPLLTDPPHPQYGEGRKRNAFLSKWTSWSHFCCFLFYFFTYFQKCVFQLLSWVWRIMCSVVFGYTSSDAAVWNQHPSDFLDIHLNFFLIFLPLPLLLSFRCYHHYLMFTTQLANVLSQLSQRKG